MLKHFGFLFLFAAHLVSYAQIVNVGDASYTTTFPGTDVAGRNSYPSGSPQLSGKALNKPVPTNDWWSKLVKENFADNLFNYPFTLKTIGNGLVVSYIPRGVIDDMLPVVVGVSGLSTDKVTVSDYSDWLVTMNWNDGSHTFEASSGIAMPFLYFSKGSSDIAQITINSGTVTIKNEVILIKDAKNTADFAIYAPSGSVWTVNGKVYTSSLNGKNYWSLGFLPPTASNVETAAEDLKTYAYVFPLSSKSSYVYDESSSVLRTDFEILTEVKEGENNTILMGLLPHQWNNLNADLSGKFKYAYSSIRGEIRSYALNSFSTSYLFKGILPTLPYLNNYSAGFNPSMLDQKIKEIENDQLALWTDSYNEGQVMNRLIQTARIANESGNIQARDKMLQTIKNRLENWLKSDVGERAFLFYYNNTWSAMLGYPAGHGQDSNLNDHHFHWGYFIHAAAFVEQFEPGWNQKFGEMINLLIRDAASNDRTDSMFPYLRSFSPFAGHNWANGFATFPQGNDQESTSESMQFNSSLIHWGAVTGNKNIRDLGIYLYVTEQAAIEEYWLDVYERNFPANQNYSLVSRVWGNDLDNGTFWTSDIAASYGIELYPIHGGSLYLAHNTAYLSKLWSEMKTNTGILSNQENVNLWHDVYWTYGAFTNPQEVIDLYDSYPDRSLKFGVSDAQTYFWLHSLNVIGTPMADVTANYPIAASFIKDGVRTYVAHNYQSSELKVTFSDGFVLNVPAGQMATSRDVKVKGRISTDFPSAYSGGTVKLELELTEGVATKVEFYSGDKLLAASNSQPYVTVSNALNPGVHSFYAKIYDNDQFNISNIITVQVGEQYAYEKKTWILPGVIESGKFDEFEGGSGLNISYLDLSKGNNGDFRTNESVDASNHLAEGAVIGWIDAGEWVEYSVFVEQSGLYDLTFRYASGNSAGGGPFALELDGLEIRKDISVPSTSNWDVWSSKLVQNIALTQGEHVLRLKFESGEFNLGKLSFVRTSDLDYSVPFANAGLDTKLILPQTQTTLDGSASYETGGNKLAFRWSQVYGPSTAHFASPDSAKSVVSNLIEGMYKFQLKVTNPDLRTDTDETLLMVTAQQNVNPVVSVSYPLPNQSFREGEQLVVSASASDFENQLSHVSFYANDVFIGTDDSTPYQVNWEPSAGTYQIVAKAFDTQSGMGVSSPTEVTIAKVQQCVINSKEASQGSFDLGYSCTYETVNNEVSVTWELFDNKVGVVAYIWSLNPFAEKQLTEIGLRKFQTKFYNLEIGSTLNYACKFAFAGGMSVTKYISYKVGDDCSTTANDAIGENSNVYGFNPGNSTLSSFASTNSNVIIYDFSGNKINENILPANSVLDLSFLSNGLYLICVESKDEHVFKTKFVKY